MYGCEVVESSRIVAASVLWWRGADREGRCRLVSKHVGRRQRLNV